MYDEVLEARNDGLSLAFFSGDTMWYEIDFYASSVTLGVRRNRVKSRRPDTGDCGLGVQRRARRCAWSRSIGYQSAASAHRSVDQGRSLPPRRDLSVRQGKW